MKILHTADWHIGKIINEFSMLDDQAFALMQMIDIIKEEKPDVVIIAGDIYDRSIPPVEAVELLDKVFSFILIELNTPILAIAGNHDSAERLSFASRVLMEKGLHIAGIFDREVKKVTLEGKVGPVNFYLLPYADPKEIKHILKDDEISNHNDAMKKIVENIEGNLEENCKNVLVAHGYVTNFSDNNIDQTSEIITSDSERPLSIGGTDIIYGEHFNCFNYTALGHLHGPQKVGSDKIRYAGSLLKYSFSETNHKKGFTIVDIDEKGEVEIKLRELRPKRDMRIIKGPLNKLIDMEIYKGTNLEDYVFAILTDEEELIDPISKLRAVYPNIMGLRKDTVDLREESKTSASKGFQQKSKLELFNEFYFSIKGKEIGDKKLKAIKDIIEEVERRGCD